ncbi:GrpB-like predicted nucleotidyltransferase (UPF0157 family) [Aquisalibacillus elongatus]|uniref:GrpB-like predicted nucleotidyltransferase (UPF0157 family) n=2 Tax=Aquisalibacillus elongatus TaxID=485577 RepID=A0A3N5CDS6_9BACI|nr:GrpB-like predicted nucleotidyltransferase (UPF0157 family) [Aquisalibacillus elongatus]
MEGGVNMKEENNKVPVWAYEAVKIVKPDPMWIEKGIQEGDEVYHSLLEFDVKKVEHIGSTAIPNLPAKPIIDLMASLPSLEPIDKIVETLAIDDWHYVPPELDKRPWRRFFVKVKNNKRVSHLHLMQTGEDRWEKQLLFRDKLRANPHLVEEYSIIKQQLALEFNNNREGYTEAKKAFINRVLLQD